MDPGLPYIHPTADVSPQAIIGAGTRIWHQAQVREGAQIGEYCIIGKGVYIDFGVTIGSNVKIQNGACVYHGAAVEDGVFLGPGAILANDPLPRAINPDGSLKTDTDWELRPVLIRRGASVGASAVILPGVTIGNFAMVGAGAVVTRDIPAHALVYGSPARFQGYVCRCGKHLTEAAEDGWRCDICDESFRF